MMPRLTIFEIIETVARNVIARPEWHDFALTCGISHEDWPEHRVRALVDTFCVLKAERGHEYARHVLSDDARTLRNFDIPTDPAALAVVYRDALKVYRAKRLADELALCHSADEVDRVMARFDDVESKSIGLYDFGRQVPTIAQRNEELRNQGKALVEIPGWPTLSQAIGGFNPGRLGLLVADSGFGKTTVALNLAARAAELSPVVFVNMEMSEQDIGERLLMGQSRTTFKKFKVGEYEPEAISKVMDRFEHRRLLYTDGRSLTVAEIFALARRTKSAYGLGFLVVDYDQKILIETTRDTPEWKAVQIAVERLEALAKELEIFVLVLAQSNDDGAPSSSRRAKHAPSVILRFHEVNGVPVLEAIKNRFGKKGATIEVAYSGECGAIDEVGFKRFDASDVGQEPKKALRVKIK